jgi:hypothetical protein
MANGRRMRGGGASHSDAQRPPSTSLWPSTRKAGPTSGVMKSGPSGIPNWIVHFPRARPAPLQLGARLANDLGLHHIKIQKVGIILFPGRATNACAVGTSADDVSALSSGGVVRTMGSIADALPPGMARTCYGFWPWRLLHRRLPLWIRRPPVR